MWVTVPRLGDLTGAGAAEVAVVGVETGAGAAVVFVAAAAAAAAAAMASTSARPLPLGAHMVLLERAYDPLSLPVERPNIAAVRASTWPWGKPVWDCDSDLD